ncbi:MAG: potassium channel protein [Fibrobacteres bacterium]|nr:potassium channel protein [Fibrobacterota bacterium]
MKRAGAAWLLLIGFGTLGYRLLGGSEWTWLDALYMTIITIACVGYGEVHDLSGNIHARVFGILLIVASFAVVAVFAASLTAAILEGRLTHSLRRRRNMKALAKLTGHQVICGLGETGISAARELRANGLDFVCIDHDLSRWNTPSAWWGNSRTWWATPHWRKSWRRRGFSEPRDCSWPPTTTAPTCFW